MAEQTKELTTLDEYIEYFTHEGFKRVKDADNGITRTIMFRKFADGDALEVIVKQIGEIVTLKQMVNGMPG